MNENLLEVRTRVDEYLKIAHEAESKQLLPDDFPAYWSCLPNYATARCPICGSVCSEKLDTYTVRHWIPLANQGSSVFSDKGDVKQCEHHVIVQAFVNFNGMPPRGSSPTEIRHCTGEKPIYAAFRSLSA
jgi:hypothetical protein